MRLYVCLLIIFLIVDVTSQQEIELDDGKILGRLKRTSDLQKTYYSFEGIPFAKPPIGELRFQPPVPNDKWEGVLNATQNRSSCIQQTGEGSEDCLYLNIFTPSLNRSNMPVMVWIFGGIFLYNDGSAANYNPEYLVEQDIVYVAMNYRVDVFGFLSTEDLVVPGNMGLKDQLLALKWVQKNIAKFGGNPNNVTIFGESAGAVSVSLHLQSPRSEGLFQGAIMNSGTSLNLWGLCRVAKTMATNLAQNLGIDTRNSRSLVEGLRGVDAKTLVKASFKNYLKQLKDGNPLAGLPYGPVIEPVHDGAFFTEKSYELLSKGQFTKVPLIIGHTSQEALLGSTVHQLTKLLLEKFNIFSSELIPVDMHVNGTLTRQLLGLDIKRRYFGFDLILSSNKNLVHFVSDDQFNRPIQEAAKLQSQFVPTYFYVFSYEGKLGDNFNRTTSGVAHGEDLNYIFKQNKTNIPPNDVQARKKVVKLWTNFVKFGNPTPIKDPLLDNVTWRPCKRYNLFYLDIGYSLVVKTNPNAEDMKFWHDMYRKHGNRPYDTY